jgi:serine/threonine-protein kinase RsbW
MPESSPSFSLTLPTDPRMLTVVRTFLEAACQALQVDRGAMHAVVMAGGEAVINIIRHAHRDKPDALINLQMRVTGDAIILEFQDEGDPFDLDAVPHLEPGDLRLGGRGVYIIRALMDQVSCQPRENRGNQLRMVKRRPTGPVRVPSRLQSVNQSTSSS